MQKVSTCVLRDTLRRGRAPRNSLQPCVRISAAVVMLLGLMSPAEAAPPRPAKRSSEGPSVRDRAASSAAPVGKAWLLGGRLELEDGSDAALPDPEIVEVLTNGSVRAKDKQGRIVEGYPGNPLIFAEGSESGLRLYARKKTPVYYDDVQLPENRAFGVPCPPFAPVTGPAIGVAQQGASLMVFRMGKTYTEVVLRGWEHSVHALVATADLGLEQSVPAASADTAAGRLVRNHRRALFTKPGNAGRSIAYTTCGPMRVLDDRVIEGERYQRVVQENEGVLLVGWVGVEGINRVPIETVRGDERCDPRTIPARLPGVEDERRSGRAPKAHLPPGFVATEGDVASLGRRIQALAMGGAKVFVPVVVGEGVRCVEYAFYHLDNAKKLWSGPRTGKSAMGLGLRRDGDEHRQIAYGAAILESSYSAGISLSGPLFEGDGALVGDESSTYVIADITPHALILVPCDRCESIAAYHRDDAEAWFLDRAACEREGSTANSSGFLR